MLSVDVRVDVMRRSIGRERSSVWTSVSYIQRLVLKEGTFFPVIQYDYKCNVVIQSLRRTLGMILTKLGVLFKMQLVCAQIRNTYEVKMNFPARYPRILNIVLFP